MRAGLNQTEICNIACNIPNEMQSLDDTEVATFAQECEHLLGDPGTAKWIEHVSKANSFQLEVEKNRLTTEMKQAKQLLHIVCYYEHLSLATALLVYTLVAMFPCPLQGPSSGCC
jgi:hypothetical protein